MATEHYCPKHLRVFGAKERCPLHGAVPCPKPQPVDNKSVMTIRCNRCDITMAAPASAITQGKLTNLRRVCQRDKCVAEFVVPAAPRSAKPTPPKISDNA